MYIPGTTKEERIAWLRQDELLGLNNALRDEGISFTELVKLMAEVLAEFINQNS